MIPVFALHGFTGGPASFDRLRAALGPGESVAAPVIAGHGPEADHATTFEDEVARLVGLLPANTPVLLLGYSMGGRLALGVAAQAPERVAATVVVGAHLGLPDEASRAIRAREDDQLAERLCTDGLDAFLASWEALPLFATQAALDPALLTERRALRRRHDARALASALSALSLGRMPDHRASIASRPQRTFFVAGADDAKFASLAREGGSLAGTPAVMVQGAGHDVLLERPDVLAEILRTTLEGVR